MPRLPDEAHRGIPGTVFARLEPTPVARRRQQDESWDAQRSSQMRRGVIDSYYHVHGCELGRENIDVRELIDRTINEDGRSCCRCLPFQLVMVSILQANPSNVGTCEQRGEQ